MSPSDAVFLIVMVVLFSAVFYRLGYVAREWDEMKEQDKGGEE